MQRIFTYLASLFLFSCGGGPKESTVTFKVFSPAPHNSKNTAIYVAGNFNGWNPADSAFQLKPVGKGIFKLKKKFPAHVKGSLEYKYTRGSWETPEADGNGGNVANREVNYLGGKLTLNDTIKGWDIKAPNSSATAQVHVFREAMDMPQLGRKRRIWVCLPSDYESSTARYPVIYMQDGQNLFDNLVAPFGEWEADETLLDFESEYNFKAIIVGIDHGDTLRLNEYSPYTHPKYGGGEGLQYLDFVVNTLKPVIDAEFRTLPEREYTAIGGSSMGGLISFCAGIEFPEVFGKLFVFSPSFWFNDQVYVDAEKLAEGPCPKIYILMGAEEGAMMVNGTKKMQAILEKTGKYTKENLQTAIIQGGKHNERFWQEELPRALKWAYELEQ
ncbi:MAG: alpha/beta hydrolase [Flammeovirgaceae bacterium]